ncbi:hypothetical protein CYLTODRAFT_426112 [Cylindrobasidium torrendii FP15055 ss-10]|uniref:BTB domain-containing protein n=1 Tax=Cylindrobasidium torrendii FP15055 ss-10 TaxID=1314674 RepID=A0A0D7B1Q3_9AGAR|nr:hypothetical protein CYLTODRAFT_426112 [Cylindrobasidium torrendii FP15055 ss-10]
MTDQFGLQGFPKKHILLHGQLSASIPAWPPTSPSPPLSPPHPSWFTNYQDYLSRPGSLPTQSFAPTLPSTQSSFPINRMDEFEEVGMSPEDVVRAVVQDTPVISPIEPTFASATMAEMGSMPSANPTHEDHSTTDHVKRHSWSSPLLSYPPTLYPDIAGDKSNDVPPDRNSPAQASEGGRPHSSSSMSSGGKTPAFARHLGQTLPVPDSNTALIARPVSTDLSSHPAHRSSDAWDSFAASDTSNMSPSPFDVFQSTLSDNTSPSSTASSPKISPIGSGRSNNAANLRAVLGQKSPLPPPNSSFAHTWNSEEAAAGPGPTVTFGSPGSTSSVGSPESSSPPRASPVGSTGRAFTPLNPNAPNFTFQMVNLRDTTRSPPSSTTSGSTPALAPPISLPDHLRPTVPPSFAAPVALTFGQPQSFGQAAAHISPRPPIVDNISESSRAGTPVSIPAVPLAESSKSMPNAAWFLLRALDGISPFDIEFVFDAPGGSRTMLAASTCLKGKSEWLDQVLQGHFPDGNVIGWDYVDDHDRLDNTPAGPSHVSIPGTRLIYIKDVAYRTWKSFLTYLYTDFGFFDPASARSIYRVAERAKMPGLRASALRAIDRAMSLNPREVVDWAFDDYSARYEEVLDAEVSFIKRLLAKESANGVTAKEGMRKLLQEKIAGAMAGQIKNAEIAVPKLVFAVL